MSIKNNKKISIKILASILFICFFSGACYINMLKKENIEMYIELGKESFREADGIVGKMDALIQWVDTCWKQSVIEKPILGQVDAGYTYLLTKEIASKQVIKGKDGWLFFKALGDGDVIAGDEGTDLFSEEQLNEISTDLFYLQGTLNYYGIGFQLLICPDKEMVYSEYMPDKYIKADVTNGDVMKEYFLTKGINTVYPKDSLIKLQKDYQLYYRYDTHWNQLGAYVAASEILENWGKEIESLNDREISSKMLRDTQHLNVGEDIARMAKLLPILDAQNPDYDYVVDGTAVVDWKKFREEEQEGVMSHFYNKDAKNKKTLLIVGDSFRAAMIPVFSEVFQDVYVVARTAYRSDALEQVKPDYLIVEYVERHVEEIENISNLILNNY